MIFTFLGGLLFVLSNCLQPMILALQAKQKLDESKGQKGGLKNLNPKNALKNKIKSKMKMKSKPKTKEEKEKQDKMKRLKAMILSLKGLGLFLKSCGSALSALGALVSSMAFIPIILLVACIGSVTVFASEGLIGGGSFTSGSINSSPIGGGTEDSDILIDIDTSDRVACCKTLAEWYIKNVPTYCQQTADKKPSIDLGRGKYKCDLFKSVEGINKELEVYDDCSSFAAAYASMVSGKNIGYPPATTAMYQKASCYINAGWKFYTITEVGGLKGLLPGDILVCSSKADSNSRGGHAEIYISSTESFGWGSVKSKYPSSWTLTEEKIDGKIYVSSGSSHRYGVLYRYEGK